MRRLRNRVYTCAQIIEETLGLDGCALYWFPNFQSLRQATNVMSLDERRVVIVSQAEESDAGFALPLEAIIVRNGTIPRVSAHHIFEGKEYKGNNLPEKDRQKLLLAAEIIHEVISSQYFDRLEEGKEKWTLIDARVTSDIGILRNPENASFLHKEREF